MDNRNPMGAIGGASEAKGQTRRFQLKLTGAQGLGNVSVSQVNGQSGTAIPKWTEMGSPKYPSATQIAELRSAAELPRPEVHALTQGPQTEFSIELPANGLALVEFTR